MLPSGVLNKKINKNKCQSTEGKVKKLTVGCCQFQPCLRLTPRLHTASSLRFGLYQITLLTNRYNAQRIGQRKSRTTTL